MNLTANFFSLSQFFHYMLQNEMFCNIFIDSTFKSNCFQWQFSRDIKYERLTKRRHAAEKKFAQHVLSKSCDNRNKSSKHVFEIYF